MNKIGRSRNARLNQAFKHTCDMQIKLAQLKGFTMHNHIKEKDAWQDARNSLEQLTQCFHEANAYNNAMKAD